MSYGSERRLLNALVVMALMGGLAVGAAALFLLFQEGTRLLGAMLAVAAVVNTVALLAASYVGLAVLDIAGATQASAQALREMQAGPPLAALAPRAAVAPVATAVAAPAREAAAPGAGPFDERRWRFLKDADPEVAAAAARMAALGPKREAELAERLLVLGDRAYLPAIERGIEAEVAREREEAERVRAAVGEDALQEFLKYKADVGARGGVDPNTGQRVLDIQPYTGRWKMFDGGVKVRLEGGTWLLARGLYNRSFAMNPDDDPFAPTVPPTDKRELRR